jgi:hypothetical protein
MKKKRSINLFFVSILFLLALVVCYWLLPQLRGVRDVNAGFASLTRAKALVIDGSFIDEQTGRPTTITVRLTDPADIAAIATLFQSARPRLDISTSYELSHGAVYATAQAGTVTIESDHATNHLHLLFSDIVMMETHTAVRLRGFSSSDIYQTLKQRGRL